MSACWPDGELRAFLDRELPAAELAQLSAHLEECSDCRIRSLILSARANRVMGLVGGLADPADAPQPALRPVPRPRPNYWAPAALALATGWAAFVLLAPSRVQAPPEPFVPTPPVVAATVPPVAVSPTFVPVAPPPIARPSAPRRALVRAPRRPARATLAGFVPLDDDPIDAGVIMRVALAEGQMQADVVYSPDGRPRAIRLVSSSAGK